MRPIVVAAVFLSLSVASAQTTEPVPEPSSQQVPLTVASGVPLRLYLTKRLPKRMNQPVEAKLLEPVYAFDRVVVPEGSDVIGKVVRLEPVTKMKRAAAILGGDFTPLHRAGVQFTEIVFPGGRRMPIQTADSIALNSIVPLHPPKPQTAVSKGNGGLLGTGRRHAQAQVDAAKEKARGVADMVRAPDKMERLEEFLLMKLPYHPQWVRSRTRYDAELTRPLEFGTASMSGDSLRFVGTQPPAESVAHVRLVTALSSASATQGDKVQAVLSQPVFSADHHLILPAGTRLAGPVAVAQHARWFHRSGRLRFNLETIDLPEGVAPPGPGVSVLATRRAQTTLESAESADKAKLKVDEEGGVKTEEPKTRFIAPVLSFLIASRAADNDEERIGRSDANVGGRTLGGASGFGLLGAAAAQSSRTVGSVLGFYGLAWSVYTNIIARGSEVNFYKDAAMDIRFGARGNAPASKLRASAPVAP